MSYDIQGIVSDLREMAPKRHSLLPNVPHIVEVAADVIEAQEARISELVEALEALTYESGGYYYVGMHGDSDVTEIVSTALSKALTPSLPK